MFLGLAVLCVYQTAGRIAATRGAGEAPTLVASWGSAGVTLSGAVSAVDHERILAAARKSFGNERVTATRLRAEPRAAALFDLAELLATAPRTVTEGVLEVDDKKLRISGSVPSEAARADLAAALGGITGPALRIVDDMTVTETPHVAEAAAATAEPAGEPVESSAPPAASAAPQPSAKPKPKPTARPAPDLETAIAAILDDRPIEFALGSAMLTARSRRTLDQVVPLLKKNPRAHLLVASHTDIWGGTAHNKLLSQKRADAVVAHFVRRGLDRRRFTAVGYGETRPIATGRTVKDISRNRRTEIHVQKGR